MDINIPKSHSKRCIYMGSHTLSNECAEIHDASAEFLSMPGQFLPLKHSWRAPWTPGQKTLRMNFWQLTSEKESRRSIMSSKMCACWAVRAHEDAVYLLLAGVQAIAQASVQVMRLYTQFAHVEHLSRLGFKEIFRCAGPVLTAGP